MQSGRYTFARALSALQDSTIKVIVVPSLSCTWTKDNERLPLIGQRLPLIVTRCQPGRDNGGSTQVCVGPPCPSQRRAGQPIAFTADGRTHGWGGAVAACVCAPLLASRTDTPTHACSPAHLCLSSSSSSCWTGLRLMMSAAGLAPMVPHIQTNTLSPVHPRTDRHNCT